MSDHVYKKIEVVGSSPNGFEEAIKDALARAEKTVRNMRWFEVTEPVEMSRTVKSVTGR